jgi:hypothetical protein
MDSKRKEESYSEQEAAKRRDEVLKRMLNTPPKPHKKKRSKAKRGKAHASPHPVSRKEP